MNRYPCEDGDSCVDEETGERCPECCATAARHFASWKAYGRAETAAARTYVADMIDAGRGHLVGGRS